MSIQTIGKKITESSLFYIGLIFLLSLVVVGNYRDVNISFGDDSTSQLLPREYFLKHNYAWNDDDLGGPSYISGLVPYYLFSYSLLSYTSLSSWAVEHLVIFLFQFFLPGLGMFLLLKYLLHHKLSAFLGALFYVFNPWHLMVFHSPIYSPLFSFLPFMFLVTHIGVTRSLKLREMFLLAGTVGLLSFFASSAISHVAFTNSLVILLGFIYFYYTAVCIIRKEWRQIRQLFLFGVLSSIFMVGFNLFWILTDLRLYLGVLTEVNEGVLSSWNAIFSTTLMNVLTLLSDWPFRAQSFNDYYFPYNSYYSNFFIILCQFSIVVLMFYPLSQPKWLKLRKLSLLPFYALLFGVLIFAKGGNEPFGLIFSFLYKHLKFFSIFRSPNKFYLTVIFLYSVLFSGGFLSIFTALKKDWIKKVFFVFTGGLVLLNSLPLVLGWNILKDPNGLIRPYEVSIPDYYSELKSMISEVNISGRVLVLPFIHYGISYLWPVGGNLTRPVSADLLLQETLLGYYENYFFNNFYGSDLFRKEPFSVFIDKVAPFLGVSTYVVERDRDESYYLASDDERNNLLDFRYFDASFRGLGLEEHPFFETTPEYISSIPIDTRSPRNVLDILLDFQGFPAVSFYTAPQEEILPRIYIPDSQILSSGGNLVDLFSYGELGSSPMIYFGNLKPESLFPGQTYVWGKYVRSSCEPVKELTWDEAWSWPISSISPQSFFYTFVPMKEGLSNLIKFNSVSVIDSLIWLGSKRVSEIATYSPAQESQQKILISAVGSYNSALNLLVNLKPSNPDAYKVYLKKLYLYAERGSAFLAKDGIVYKDLDICVKKIGALIEEENTCVCSNCFTFKVPFIGSYDLNLIDEEKSTVSTSGVGISDLKYKYDISEKKPILNIPIVSSEHIFNSISLKGLVPGNGYELYFEYKVKPKEPFNVKLFVEHDEDSGIYKKLVKKWAIDRFSNCIAASDNCSYFIFLDDFEAVNETAYLLIDMPGSLENWDFYPSIRNFKITEVNTDKAFLTQKNAVPEFEKPSLEWRKINPTKYEVDVTDASAPYFLVLNNTFNPHWDVFLKTADSSESIPGFLPKFIYNLWQELFSYKNYDELTVDNIKVNGYANAWYIDPRDTKNMGNYTLMLQYSPQRSLYHGIMFTGLTALVYSFFVLMNFGYLIFRRKHNEAQ